MSQPNLGTIIQKSDHTAAQTTQQLIAFAGTRGVDDVDVANKHGSLNVPRNYVGDAMHHGHLHIQSDLGFSEA